MKKSCFLALLCLITSVVFSLHVNAKGNPVIAKVKLYQNIKSSKIEIKLTGPLDKMPDLMASLQTVSFDLNELLPEKKRKRVKKNKLTDEDHLVGHKRTYDFVELSQQVSYF